MILGLGLVIADVGSSSIQIEETTNAHDNKNKSTHRVFPAASIESYNPHNLPPTLGVLSNRNEISFAISISSAAESDPSVKSSIVIRRGAENQNDSENEPVDVDSRTAEGPRRRTNRKGTKTDVESILRPALTRFQDSLGIYPEFRYDYPINPNGLPLLPISKTFLIVLESSDVDLYHGVPEDYKIDISLQTTSAFSRRMNGAFDENLFYNPRNTSRCYDAGTENVDSSRLNADRFVLISIEASTVFGVLRALETLGQLLEFGWMNKNCNDDNVPFDSVAGDDSGVFVIRDIPLHISDKPTFPFRGLMIDTARHFLPMTLILNNLDAMAMNKLNVLHWHISDSQSFPYAPQTMPELARKGAYHPRRIYTPGDVRTLVREAYLRGIRVIPEVDMPGHTNAIAASHPEVMSHCPHPSEPINPTVPETYGFIQELYRDLNEVFVSIIGCTDSLMNRSLVD